MTLSVISVVLEAPSLTPSAVHLHVFEYSYCAPRRAHARVRTVPYSVIPDPCTGTLEKQYTLEMRVYGRLHGEQHA